MSAKFGFIALGLIIIYIIYNASAYYFIYKRNFNQLMLSLLATGFYLLIAQAILWIIFAVKILAMN